MLQNGRQGKLVEKTVLNQTHSLDLSHKIPTTVWLAEELIDFIKNCKEEPSLG